MTTPTPPYSPLRYGAFNVDCPRCQQPKGQRCRTMSRTYRVTDTHSVRHMAAWQAHDNAQQQDS